MTDRVRCQWWGNVRMRWDCHSNAIEGGSLSYADTLDVLVHDRTPAGGRTQHQSPEVDATISTNRE